MRKPKTITFRYTYNPGIHDIVSEENSEPICWCEDYQEVEG